MREAEETLARMGIDITTAINMFLRQVVNDQGLPFQPNLHPSNLENLRLNRQEDYNFGVIPASTDYDASSCEYGLFKESCVPRFELPDEREPPRPSEKMSFRIQTDLADEIRSASMQAMAHGEVRSLSEWVVNAILMRLENERIKYNHGLPFEPREKGTIPTGRR